MKKAKSRNNINQKGASLNEQLSLDERSQYAKPSQRQSQRKRNKNDNDNTGDEAVHLTKKESKKILSFAKDQLLSVEHGLDDDHAIHHQRKHVKLTPANKHLEEDDSSIEDDDEYGHDEDDDENEDEFEEEDFEITPEDEMTIAAFSKKNSSSGTRTLGDIIMEKLAAHNQEQSEVSFAKPPQQGNAPPPLHPDVISVYTSVGELLSRYKSGKVPKAFKILPALLDWEHVVQVTKPEKWSPQAMYQATRLFASNSQPEMAAKFYSLYLLPAVRTDIAENKVLNYHHYQSIKKAIFKPKAFFKGFLFPLCEEDCTLREATIVGSVLNKVSIPVMHAGVALMVISRMPYTGSTSLFLRVLMNKKYSLPGQVVDTLQHHFLGFLNEERVLPVLWHQALLVFVQRYRGKVDKDQFLNLIKVQFHPKISPEIRRELMAKQ